MGSTSAIQGSCALNPFHHKLTCRSATAGTVISAVLTIMLIGGVLALLASRGIPVGPFNALGTLTTTGGGILAGGSALLLLVTIAWWVAKAKEACSQPKKEAQPDKIEVKPSPKPISSPHTPPISLRENPFDPYYADAIQFSPQGELTVNNTKVHELIACVHQIEDKSVVQNYLLQAIPNTFLHNLLTCRLTRLELEEKGHFLFDFEHDCVIPVCKEGKNRSAAISGALQLMYPELEVLPVHGAVGGFDPGSREDWSGLAAYVDNNEVHEAIKYNGFRLALGVDRPPRFGEEQCRKLQLPLGTEEWQFYSGVKLSILYLETPSTFYLQKANLSTNDQKVETLKEWHDENLFRLGNTREGRVFFIPVVKEARDEVLERLKETGGEAVVTQKVDYRDHTNTAKTPEEAAKQFTQLLALFLTDLKAGNIFPL